jgi:hypothetical protein
MMARIRELAHEKHESITAEDWEKVCQNSRVFALDCMDVDDSDDITNLVHDLEIEDTDLDEDT